MDDQAEWTRRAPPMTPPPPPPPSPAITEDNSTDAILWAACDDCSSDTSHADVLSLWLTNYSEQPQPEAEEEPLADVPTLVNFALESSFPDLVDWNTTSDTVKQVPVVTEPLWVQLHAPAAGEEDDLTGLTLGIQSPKPSISPLALRNELPGASVSPQAAGIQPPPSSFEIQSPQASLSPLTPGKSPPQTSSRIETPQASFSPLTPGKPPTQTSSGIETPQASFSPLTPGKPPTQTSSGIETQQASVSPLARGIPFPQASISPPISPAALGMHSPKTPGEIQSAPDSFSTSPPSIPRTSPLPPPPENFQPSPSPVPGRRSWSVFPSTPPPAWRQLLLPHSANSSMTSPSSHPSHQTHHSFPTANTGSQQQAPAAHAPVTFSTPNATANSVAGFDPGASRPSWSQMMAQRGSWASYHPWIGNGQDIKLPIPRRPPLLLRPATATMPESPPPPPPLFGNFGSAVGNVANSNASGDVNVPGEDQQPVPTGNTSRPSRKKSKLAVRHDNKRLMFKK